MAIWGYFRITDPTSAAGDTYDDLLRHNNTASAESVRREPYNDNDRHHHEKFEKLVNKECGNGDTIVVVRLSHLSMEFYWISKMIKLISDFNASGKTLNFVALEAGIDTRPMSAGDRASFLSGLSQLAIIGLRAKNGGGDGGGNGGC
jgi:hypothetical protein